MKLSMSIHTWITCLEPKWGNRKCKQNNKMEKVAKWTVYIEEYNKLIDSNMDYGRSVCESAIFVTLCYWE